MALPKYDVLGNPLTNLGGYVFNQFEGGLTQKEADADAFGGANLYGDGSAWAEVVAAGFNNHVNGTNGVWLRWEKVGTVCHVEAAFAYDVDQPLTLAQYNQAVAWAGDPTCGDGVVDFLNTVTFNGVTVVHNGEEILYNEI